MRPELEALATLVNAERVRAVAWLDFVDLLARSLEAAAAPSAGPRFYKLVTIAELIDCSTDFARDQLRAAGIQPVRFESENRYPAGEVDAWLCSHQPAQRERARLSNVPSLPEGARVIEGPRRARTKRKPA